MRKKLTISVAITAYNSENHIKKLVESLVGQKTNSFLLKEIIINSDSSTDSTVKILYSIKSSYIKVIDSQVRTGFAGALVRLVKNNTSDILIVLNDDIIIKDKFFLEKAVKALLKNKNIGLICCNIQPLKSHNFVSEAVRSGFNAYKNLGESINNGNNMFTNDGKVLCFSKPFSDSITFPNDLKEMGNVDRYVYFSCLQNKFKYKYEKKAVVYFKCPSSIKDFIKWQTRNYQSAHDVNKKFNKLAKKEYKFPKKDLPTINL